MRLFQFAMLFGAIAITLPVTPKVPPIGPKCCCCTGHPGSAGPGSLRAPSTTYL